MISPISSYAQTADPRCQQSLGELQEAVEAGQTFFIKVHAAENLVRHHRPEGLAKQFTAMAAQSPDQVIGAARVLARLSQSDPAEHQRYVHQLLHQLEQGSSPTVQLTALESLAKLGYAEALPSISRYADTSTDGFRGMARWVLSNSHTAHDEDRLSELLLSAREIDYRYGAYAIRFQDTASVRTVSRLRECFHRLSADDAARVYVTSSLFIHGNGADKTLTRPVLRQYLQGKPGERYETAEALGIGGDAEDLPMLETLFNDENRDVRVAAANAMLNLLHCTK